MKICLAMIVKNEAKVIEQCIKSVMPIIDSFCILDTGSTDKTIDKIHNILTKTEMSGVINTSKWKNFGENRTEVFDIIRKRELGDWALVVDADDIIRITNQLSRPWETIRKEIKEKINGFDVADVQIQSETIIYDQRRLFNMTLPWKYEGPIHEYPTVEGKLDLKSTKMNVFSIIHTSKGSSWKDQKTKYEGHAKVLKEWKPDPKSPNYELNVARRQFYLAQSLKAAGRTQEALIEYRKRAEMKIGWEQEAIYSQLLVARLEEWLEEKDRALIDYMECYNRDPERAEALAAIIKMLRVAGKFNLGVLFAEKLITMKQPEYNTKMFIEQQALGWEAFLEAGLCLYYTGKKKSAKTQWKKALRMNPPDYAKKQLEKNLEFVKGV